LIKRHELTPDLLQLRSSLIATCKIMEVRFSEFDEWEAEVKKVAEDEKGKLQELLKLLYEAGDDLRSVIQTIKAKRAKALPSRSPQPHSGLTPRLPSGLERRFGILSSERGKVGRNDPGRQKRPLPLRERQEVQDVLHEKARLTGAAPW
jgi:hypothetical protein